MAVGKGSLPAGQATCQACRRERRIDACLVWPRNCDICGRPFIARHPKALSCGSGCAKIRVNRSDDYHRHKRRVRRTVTRHTDITPKQEAEMYRRTRKCRLCGVWMTSRPQRPNSKELDHIVPVGMGGTHTHGNVRIICRLCNLKRTKDGSDYFGPVTLWATAPGIVITPKPQRQPSKPRTLRTVIACEKCGAGFPPQNSGQRKCGGCLDGLTLEAWQLRQTGMKWQEICDALGYPNTGGLYLRVKRMRELVG